MFNLFSRKRRKVSEAEQYVEYGVQARLDGDWDAAKASAQAALRLEPDNPDAHYLLGIILLSRGDVSTALTHFDAAASHGPEQGRIHFSRGEALAAAGRLGEAAESFERAVGLDSRMGDWWRCLGQALLGLGRFAEAADVFRRASEAIPSDPLLRWMRGEALAHLGQEAAASGAFVEAWELAAQPPHFGFRLAAFLVGRPDPAVVETLCRCVPDVALSRPEIPATRALCLARINRLEEGLALALDVTRSNPDCALAWVHYGIALRAAGRRSEAVDAHRRAVSLAPDHVEVLVQCATTLIEAGQGTQAEPLLTHAASLAPDNGEVVYRLACVLKARRALEEAEVLFRRAHKLSGGHGNALIDLSDLLVNQGRHKEAAEVLLEMLALNPDSPEANVNLGVALMGLKKYELAIERLHRAGEVDPRNVSIRVNLSNIYCTVGQPSQAEIEARMGLEIDPDNAKLLLCLANAVQALGRFEESVALQRRLVELRPDWLGPWSNLLLGLNYLQDVTPEALCEEHRRFGRMFTPRPVRTPEFFERDPMPGRRLRIGYVSPDFRSHVVGMFVEPILVAHDRSRFEIYCYFTSPNGDARTTRFRDLADIWRDVAGLSDDEMEALMLDDRLDIVVDLAGHTGGNRLPVFARRVAPVQVTWLGYPNGTGLETMDWRISDDKADPAPEADAHYVERLARLPDTFIVYEPPPDTPATKPLPYDSNGFITFGAFNNYQKVTDEALHVWKAILERVPGSRLVAKSMAMGDPVLQESVRRRFEAIGFDLSRVELQSPVRDTLANLDAIGNVDIALDTFPYNGTTTTCELLWMGVPVITVAGNRHASRVGVSLLKTVGLDDCIGSDTADYVERAVRLASDPDRLQTLRQGLRARAAASPLGDVPRFVRTLEKAYGEMWAARPVRAQRRD